MINTTFERLKGRNFFICRHVSFYEQLKFVFVEFEKFYNLGACYPVIENVDPDQLAPNEASCDQDPQFLSPDEVGEI